MPNSFIETYIEQDISSISRLGNKSWQSTSAKLIGFAKHLQQRAI